MIIIAYIDYLIFTSVLYIIMSVLIILIFVFLVITLYYITQLDTPKYLQENLQGNNEQYTAVIVEPRKHPALEFVLDNFINNLDNNWKILVLHGNENEDYVKNIIAKNADRITMESLKVDNLTIQEYNRLLVSKEFYDKIPTEVFLIFQTDTMICSEYKDKLNDFIKYDYVGAPFGHLNSLVGNGGLSLRRKSKMLEIINKCKYDGNMPEDYFFSKNCPEVKSYIPTSNKAKEFSVETIYNNISFGVHKPWTSLTQNELENKQNQCKGLDKLISMNK